MIRGIYTAVSGMITQEAKQEVITNNLANVQTAGFKADNMVVKKFDDVLIENCDKLENGKNKPTIIGSLSRGSKIDGTYTNYNQGDFENTNSTTDFAITGKGFFTVQRTDASGNTKNYYTRDGHFHVDNKGYLRTDSGDLVLGLNLKTNKEEPMQMGQSEVGVDSNNNITLDGTKAYRLSVNDFSDYGKLKKQGNNQFEGDNPTNITNSKGLAISQRVLEKSNVDVTGEVVSMMTVMRSYESSQKVIQSLDETLEKVVNEVGTVR